MFKVGDKVKFVGIVPKKWVGLTGIIIEVRPPARQFLYKMQFDIDGHNYPVLANEVEKITRGQQLLFPFMDKIR